MSRLVQWLRRLRQRDDLHLFKQVPIDELREIVAEAQERDATDERRLYPTFPCHIRRSDLGGVVILARAPSGPNQRGGATAQP